MCHQKGFYSSTLYPINYFKKCQNLVCPVSPLFVFSSFSKKTCQTEILRTYGTYVLTKSSLLGCSWTRPSMNSDKTLSPIGKNKVERNSCEKNHYSHYYYFFLFIYYYSFKIFSHFWLAKIPSIIFIITSYCWPNLKNFAICVLMTLTFQQNCQIIEWLTEKTWGWGWVVLFLFRKYKWLNISLISQGRTRWTIG